MADEITNAASGAPDLGGAGGESSAPSISPGSGASAAPGSPPAASSAPAGAEGVASPSSTPATLRDQLRGLGLDFNPQQLGDDAAIVRHLAGAYHQAQQSQQLAPYGQLYLQHAAQFQEYLRAQQAQQTQQQQASQKKWFEAPEYNPAWRDQIERDPVSGALRVKEGFPPDTLQKYLTAVRHQQQFQDKFAFDPIGAIKPGIEEVVRAEAMKIVQEHLGAYQDQNFAQSYVSQNGSWLYQKDASGQTLTNPQTGRPMLSSEGQAFRSYVMQAEQMGMSSIRSQQEYALGMVQRDLLLRAVQSQATGQQGSPGQPSANQQIKDQFTQQQGTPPNWGGSIQPQNPQGTAPAQNSKVTLADRLKQRFQQNGVALNAAVDTIR